MSDIEVIVTLNLILRIAGTDYLALYVPDKDKESIWDGAIYVYSHKDKRSLR